MLIRNLLLFFTLICLSLFAEEEVRAHKLPFQGYVTSSHPGAYHQLFNVSLPGGIIKLEDGSEWGAAPYYWEALKEWRLGDTVLLTPYRPWFFHYYEFTLVNERTGDEALVNWCKPPQRESGYTRTITRRNAYTLTLDDGTRWRVKGGDREVMRSWKRGDIVIIGTNNGWLSWSNPNILVNMRDSSYVRGACMH